MDLQKLRELLADVKAGSVDIDNAVSKLKALPFNDVGYAKIDSHRAIRNGFPEVIYCEGKAIEHIQGIVVHMQENGGQNIMATRADSKVYNAILEVAPNALYNKAARIVAINPTYTDLGIGTIAVVTGGTADIPVAEEAAYTAELMGNKVERVFDVGVAGIHRLISKLDVIHNANVIIAVAGMEGALASVVGGLVDRPVIAVPTSVGYGANFGGLSALLCMLNSCASGVTVVNIDNGFGAGFSAAIINRRLGGSA